MRTNLNMIKIGSSYKSNFKKNNMFKIYRATLHKFFISSDDLSNSLLSLLLTWYSMDVGPTLAVQEV